MFLSCGKSIDYKIVHAGEFDHGKGINGVIEIPREYSPEEMKTLAEALQGEWPQATHIGISVFLPTVSTQKSPWAFYELNILKGKKHEKIRYFDKPAEN